jgi:hypothetical protein
MVGTMLSNKYIVSLGLISYSAYLWHQPLFALLRHRSLDYPTQSAFILLTAVVFVLAYFTWRYIERPFRDRTRVSRLALLTMCMIGSSVIVYTGIRGNKNVEAAKNQLSWTAAQSLPKKFEGIVRDGQNCSGRPPKSACVLDAGNPTKTFIVIGDSHARVLTQTIYENMDRLGVRLIDLTASGCPFLVGLSLYVNHVRSDYCNEDLQNQRLEFLKSQKPANVILFSRLPLYMNGTGFNNGVGGVELRDVHYMSRDPDSNSAERSSQIRQSFMHTVKELTAIGHKVIIVGPIPPLGWNAVDRLLKIERLSLATTDQGRKNLMAIPLNNINTWRSESISVIRDVIQSSPGVIYVDPDDLLCDSEYCNSVSKDAVLYSDNNHLSLSGSSRLLDKIMSVASGSLISNAKVEKD